MAHLAFPPPESSPEPPEEGRLDSWKEIAAYLRHDVRTVQRWEKSEGLPVRRHQHDLLGSVYAYRHELDAWREGRQPALGPPETAVRGRRHLQWAALGGLVVLASAGLVATRPLWNGQGTAPVVLRTVQLTNDRLPKLPQLATDGPRLYLSERVGERWVVYAVPTNGGDPVAVPIPLTLPIVLDVSPDGSDMLVADGAARVLEEAVIYDSALYRVPAGGGPPRRVGEVMTHSAAWLPDGRSIVCLSGRHVKLVDREGTALRTLATLPGVPGCVAASPDGRLIRFSVVDPRGETWSLWEVGVDGVGPRPVLPGWSHGTEDPYGVWSPRRDYFFMSGHGGTLGVWAVRGGRRWFGHEAAPARLTIPLVPAGVPLASRDGRRLFLMGALAAGELVRWDPVAREFRAHPAGIPGAMVDFSRDGAWIVYVAFPSNTLWRARADGTERRRLTDPPLEVGVPRWSPDGERIAFMGRTRGQPWRIYAVASEGGVPVPLADGQGVESDPGWSPDGRSLIFARDLGEKPHTRLSLQVLDLATGRTSALPGSEGKFSPRWSPDGRHLTALPAQWQKLLVLDLETGRWSEPVTGDLGFQAWSRDGTHLYFQTEEEGDLVIHRLRLRDGQTERVASRKGVPQSYTFIGSWFGLDPEDRPLLLRDTTVVEVFAFDYAFR